MFDLHINISIDQIKDSRTGPTLHVIAAKRGLIFQEVKRDGYEENGT